MVLNILNLFIKTDDQLISRSNRSLTREENFENDQSIEAMWVVKAVEHAEIYFNILCSVDPKLLRLTPHDDKIYKTFREFFPDIKVDFINEDELKSEAGKQKWRPFCEQFKYSVEDYSFGTLLRSDCNDDYLEENSILTTRIQFYAIELARNREGFNDQLRQKFRINNKTNLTNNHDIKTY
ncbi:PREDICTED: protein PBDC1 [Ceratosolen solmsi marchali]|uniref:Protein PBDC1 n=1 Tax=Ceratosolen solmsi marchali TaxID=326594 RepID=A0AAJ7DZL3_9HYME|nr:PREDICTED: protein PBDC1 [Ceratosolen solmsi marchali]